MVFRSSIVFFTISFLLVHQVHPQLIVGGWQVSTDEQLTAEMVGLAQTQLVSSYGAGSSPVKVIQLEKQVVAGTNLRLTFQSGQKLQCILTAFKPLPHTNNPTQVKSFTCQEVKQKKDSESCSGEDKTEKKKKKQDSKSCSEEVTKKPKPPKHHSESCSEEVTKKPKPHKHESESCSEEVTKKPKHRKCHCDSDE